MPQQRRGLGKGLGALIPPAAGTPARDPSAPGPALTDQQVPSSPGQRVPQPGDVARDQHTPGAVPGAYFEEVASAAITPNPRQPRQSFDEESLDELAASIREVGLLQPVVVRKVMPGHYELIMGERRWRASQRAGLDRVPAIVREASDDELLRNALIENLHREQLNALEEAAAYQQLLDDFGATHEELAGRVGRSRPHISNTLRLLNLPPAVQKRVAAGVLSAGHARALLGVDNPQAQEHLAHRIVAEGLSVRAVEEIIAVGDVAPVRASRDPRSKPPAPPQLRDLAARLSDAFETHVKVEMGRRKGKIVVEFASLDDLERIIDVMSPAGRDTA
ncbi:MAG TPA: ParB/RepB/Spo0J family partition protein [Streptosporangiaceae bacterium]|nr:ParB/RepB/Spo0J family partition protein [Streptosporangiaceae bacterium]